MESSSSVPEATRRYNEKQESLLAAASALFNERGVRGATLSDVAAQVGLVKNSVTYYYKRKEDLAAACFLRTIEVFGDLIDRAGTLPTPEERVRELIRLHLVLQADIRSGGRPPVMTFHDIRALTEPVVHEVFSAYTQMFRRVRGLLKGAASSALLRDELNARAHMVVSLVNSVPRLARRYGSHELDRVHQHLCDLVLHGVRAGTSKWQDSGPELQWLLSIKGDTPRENFLRAATELINEQGYRGASVDRISDRLHLTKGAFYYYNENKDRLVEQCFEHSFRTIRTAIDLTEQIHGTGWQHACSLARGLVRLQVSPEGPLLRFTAHSALPDPIQRAHVTEDAARLRDKATGLIVTGLVDGSLRQVDPFIAAHYLLNSIDAAAELKRWAPGASEDNVSSLYVRPMLMGILCDEAAGS